MLSKQHALALAIQEDVVNRAMIREGSDVRACFHVDRTRRAVSEDMTVIECDYCPAAVVTSIPAVDCHMYAWSWRDPEDAAQR